ncbi:MAG: twin transmembrane helix small protein [Paracoccus sp. (in: a-proteobacteria)]|nr:twin transmembrane helix small protein [Paracoccus sp. (in: a-proteobacteria)]
MNDMSLLVFAALLCGAVVVVLAVGLGGYAGGGAFNRRHGNRMMRWRIIAQAAAVLAILLYVTLRGAG